MRSRGTEQTRMFSTMSWLGLFSFWDPEVNPGPPALIQARRRSRIAGFVMVVTAAGLLLVSNWDPLPESAGVVVQGIGFLLVVLAIRGVWFSTRRFHKKLKRHDFNVCLQCGYPLAGLPAKHKCPECGASYEMDQLGQTWRSVFSWIRPNDCANCGYKLVVIENGACSVCGMPIPKRQDRKSSE